MLYFSPILEETSGQSYEKIYRLVKTSLFRSSVVTSEIELNKTFMLFRIKYIIKSKKRPGTFLKKNKSIISDDYSVSFSMEKVNFHNKVGRSKK